MEKEMKKHIEEERLEAYAMQLLAGDELASVEEHLLFCETCQDQLQAVERHVKAMQSAAMRVRKEENEAPAVSGAYERLRALLRALLHVPIPVWCGVAAMGVLFFMVTVQSRQHPGTPVDVELQAVRGEPTGTAPAGHALRLRLDNHGVEKSSAWHIEIVDSEGSRVWSGTGTWSDTAITAAVSKSFTPGTYFVRLLRETEDTIREYQLVVQ
jgi:hypothetical protein